MEHGFNWQLVEGSNQAEQIVQFKILYGTKKNIYVAELHDVCEDLREAHHFTIG
jgi:hypothetical protein